MSQIYIYSKESNTIKEKAWIDKPQEPYIHEVWVGVIDMGEFETQLEHYNQHIASLKEFPCDESCRNVWCDGQEVQLQKDFYIIPLGLNERKEIFKIKYPNNTLDDFAPPKGTIENQSLFLQWHTRLNNAGVKNQIASPIKK